MGDVHDVFMELEPPVDEAAVNAYAGKRPADVVRICASENRAFGAVERAYCSQYFSEQFALIEADMAIAASEAYDPMFEGMDMSEPLPAYLQAQKDMYAQIDTDFFGRTCGVIDEYIDAAESLKKLDGVKNDSVYDGLVDDHTFITLRENGLPYSASRENCVPSDIVKAALAEGRTTLDQKESRECDLYVMHKITESKLNDRLCLKSKGQEERARYEMASMLSEIAEAQTLLNDKTPDGVAPYSILSYETVKDLRKVGFDYGIKGMSAESLLDVSQMFPEDMVACAEEAGIKWDSSMQRRMDACIMNAEEKSRSMDPDEFVGRVIKAERMAAASDSNIFDRAVPDGVFHNGSKVSLYTATGRASLERLNYDELSKAEFEDYLAGLRDEHVSDKQKDSVSLDAVDSSRNPGSNKKFQARHNEPVVTGVRCIFNKPEFSSPDDSAGYER